MEELRRSRNRLRITWPAGSLIPAQKIKGGIKMMKKLTEMILDWVVEDRENYAAGLEKQNNKSAAQVVREGILFLQSDGALYFRWKEDSNCPANHEEDHYH